MTRCTLTADGSAIAIKSPYDPGFVAALKSKIPPSSRRWDGANKAWIVTPGYGRVAQDLCMEYFNELPLLPTLKSSIPVAKQQILDVRYIGITKDRGSDERSAYGWYRDGWNVVFPETVLRVWFDAPADPTQAVTLYAILAIKRDATADEIKSAYRRLAMQWHPDHSKEPNAHEQFIAIQHAYETLTKHREKYDAGLALEASIRSGQQTDSKYAANNGYRSPLRCGMILCEGIESMGLFQVSKIYAWQDVTDSYGHVLVSSWPKGADTFEERWI